jgi:beta-barrel assembly-enhancing protease
MYGHSYGSRGSGGCGGRLIFALLIAGVSLVIATYDPNNPVSAGSAQVAMLIGQLINLKYSREDELEADALGVCFLNDAGYDPQEMINVMQILAALDQGGNTPEFFSIHPNPASRITRIQETKILSQSLAHIDLAI